MAQGIHETDRVWIASVLANLADDTSKLVYADWLEERGDDRATFLRKFVRASRSMKAADFPDSDGLPEEWLELIGFRMLEGLARAGHPEMKDRVLRLARPALRLVKEPMEDAQISVGGSKIGGLPDLAPGIAWPPGGDCHAIYNDDTGGTDRLAGFMAQINLAEIAHTCAAKILPSAGVLSFFCFQDWENDHPDAIGAKAFFFADSGRLKRSTPPKKLTNGNHVMPSERLTFQETLDLPDAFEGPWSDELNPERQFDNEMLDNLRTLNFHNLLGYARATTGSDPTPSRESRHLIVLKNPGESQLHIQIHQDDLAKRNFDGITLNWVDFD